MGFFDHDKDRLSKKDAAHRRDVGMGRAEDHAERVTENWRETGDDALEQYLRERGDESFLSEHFIEWTRKHEVPQPPDARAWGSVVRAARMAGRIEQIGAAPAATSNLGLKIVWKQRKASR